MKEISIRQNIEPVLANNTGNRISDVKKGDKSFVGILSNSINEVNKLQKEADIAAKNLAVGQTDNIHEVAIAMEKADISFRLLVQVRGKILEAYQEVMRMQI